MYAHVYVSTDKSLERYTHFRSAEERRVRTSNEDGRERGVQLREGTVTLQTVWGIHFPHLRLRRLADDVRAGTAFGLLARASPHTCGFLGGHHVTEAESASPLRPPLQTGLDPPLFSLDATRGRETDGGGTRTVHLLILLCIQGLGLERLKVNHHLSLRRIDCHHTALYEALSCAVRCCASPAGLGRQHWREELDRAAAWQTGAQQGAHFTGTKGPGCIRLPAGPWAGA